MIKTSRKITIVLLLIFVLIMGTAHYLANGKSLYYQFTKSGKLCIARSDGKIIINDKFGNGFHTAGDTFMVSTTKSNKDQRIYNINGKLIMRYNNAFPLVTFEADGTGCTLRTLDFWEAKQGKTPALLPFVVS